jgi:alkylresorcinol/alkylpyrone synthase
MRGRGDGAPRVIAKRSVFYPDTERMMGWDVVGSRFKIVLSPAIPDLVRAHICGDVDYFLAAHGLERLHDQSLGRSHRKQSRA